MQTNFIKNLLNLEDVIVKNIKNLKEKVEIYIELPVKEHLCPYCGAETTKIHDYRTQIITDIPVYFKNTKLIYNKRRYECKLCHKSFYENNSIVNKYSRKSTRLTEFVVDHFVNFLLVLTLLICVGFLLGIFLDFFLILL